MFNHYSFVTFAKLHCSYGGRDDNIHFIIYIITRMKIKFIIVILFFFVSFAGKAQLQPTIQPMATFITANGETTEQQTSFSGSAPLQAKFFANVANAEQWQAHYEWRFYLEEQKIPYLIRNEKDTHFTFTKAGTHRIVLFAVFIQGNDTVQYTQEYWKETIPITVSIAESKLEMPNAFSPNGDGINDIYKPKEGWQSIVEFKAYIYNRWGQKIFEWTNPAEGWNGKYKGKDVKQGVYFCLVKAKGADGHVFNIKTDVNLLRSYQQQ